MFISYENNYAMLNDTKTYKHIHSVNFNHVLDKRNGLSLTWGKNKKDDPNFCPFGPLIADIEITTICNGPEGTPCSFCFPGDTKIKTKKGEKNISDIKIEDIVYSYDEDTKKIVTNEVLYLYERMDNEFIIIELEDGTELKMTKEHPVYIKNIG